MVIIYACTIPVMINASQQLCKYNIEILIRLFLGFYVYQNECFDANEVLYIRRNTNTVAILL